MRRKQFSYSILGLSIWFLLLPVAVQADFIIEFTDGRQVTVSRYVEDGRTITIHTPMGAIGFRTEDVKRITEVGANQSTSTPLETVSVRSAASAPTSEPAPVENEKQTEAKQANESERERLDTEYHDVAQQIDELWEKHLQNVNSGASEEILAEDARKLDELNGKRHKLIKATRQANPDDLPAWAQ